MAERYLGKKIRRKKTNDDDDDEEEEIDVDVELDEVENQLVETIDSLKELHDGVKTMKQALHRLTPGIVGLNRRFQRLRKKLMKAGKRPRKSSSTTATKVAKIVPMLRRNSDDVVGRGSISLGPAPSTSGSGPPTDAPSISRQTAPALASFPSPASPFRPGG